MRDFPSCFGENGVQVADSSSSSSSSRNGQNLVSCVYRTHLRGQRCLVSVTWSRTLMGQGFTVGVDDPSTNLPLCKVEIKPWLFSKRKGSRSLDLDDARLDVVWDLSAARFGAGPEPLEGFFVAVVFGLEMVLLLGDLAKEAYRKANAGPPACGAAFVARREHLYGRRVYSTRAQLCGDGRLHDVVIECETAGTKEPCLEIRIDRKRVMQVKRLAWKFRGNQTILVDGLPVEVFWDVHSWLFGAPVGGNAVFMFQTCASSADKLLPVPRGWREPPHRPAAAEEDLGFSLVLYAWKNE